MMAQRGAAARSGQTNPAPLPRSDNVIRWLLILTGLIVIGLGIGLRENITERSRTIERVAGKPTKVSMTTEPFSDKLLIAALGLGGALVFCGAFYTRINKVTFPGGSGVELADYHAAAEAVGRAAEKQLGVAGS